MDILSAVYSLISKTDANELAKLYEIESKNLGKLFQSPFSNAEGLTEDKSALRYIPSKRLSIRPGQRIFPVRY